MENPSTIQGIIGNGQSAGASLWHPILSDNFSPIHNYAPSLHIRSHIMCHYIHILATIMILTITL